MKKLSILLCYCWALLGSCDKQDEWLDKKLNKQDVIPTTISDFQALMDNADIFSLGSVSLGLIATDNYYVPSADLFTEQQYEINSYRWDKVIFTENISGDWSGAYMRIFYANVALEGLAKINPGAGDRAAYNLAKGMALFFRGSQFYDLAQTFALPYNPNNLKSPGIPLRMTPDITVKSVRASIEDTYRQIIEDLKGAAALLPLTTVTKYRPSQVAANAMLARVYLGMGDYDNAKVHAGKALEKSQELIDFNTLDLSLNNTFPSVRGMNSEVLFFNSVLLNQIIRCNYIARVDSVLYRSYEDNDLRKAAFYTGPQGDDQKIVFKGSYSGGRSPFSGLAVNELLLIKAEAEARSNQLQDAMSTIAQLLNKRYVTGTYVAPALTSQGDVIDYILRERRKELPFTGQLRWEDLRRLNQEPSRAVTLRRLIDLQVYSLPPNDPRYAYPIPEQEIDIYGLTQNNR